MNKQLVPEAEFPHSNLHKTVLDKGIDKGQVDMLLQAKHSGSHSTGYPHKNPLHLLVESCHMPYVKFHRLYGISLWIGANLQ